MPRCLMAGVGGYSTPSGIDTLARAEENMHPSDAGPWIGDWAWGLPLIVLTVVIHVCGLALIGERVVRKMTGSLEHRRFLPRFVLVMGRTSFEVTILHGIEAGIWAIAFRILG